MDPTQTSTLRNGIGVSKPGDKRYSHPDYAPGFFKGGGVYPGSGWGYVGPIVAAIAPLASHHSVCLCVCVPLQQPEAAAAVPHDTVCGSGKEAEGA